jgi:protein TonB
VPTPLGYGRLHAVPYPGPSARRGEHGLVLLRVLIGSDGVPQRIEIEKSSGFLALDRAARDAVMKWRFTAGTKNGVPYTAWGRVPIEFQLDKQ